MLIPVEPVPLPPPGTRVRQQLDWERRHRHMRVHSALHLLSVAIPHPVAGGQIGAGRGWLDFHMPDTPASPEAVEALLNGWIVQDLKVSEHWITEAELAASPGLVRTLAVAAPGGRDWVRLIGIGEAGAPLGLQPCGGTHMPSTPEIGAVRIGKIGKKGRINRRVSLFLA